MYVYGGEGDRKKERERTRNRELEGGREREKGRENVISSVGLWNLLC